MKKQHDVKQKNDFETYCAVDTDYVAEPQFILAEEPTWFSDSFPNSFRIKGVFGEIFNGIRSL